MPKTNAEIARELAKLSPDCSFLLTHLIRQSDGRKTAQAKAILESILDIGGTPPRSVLKASANGWYGTADPYIFNPETETYDGRRNNRAVCFTKSTLAGLKAHRDIFDARYGIAFDRDHLFERGANPCLNVRASLLRGDVPRPMEGRVRSVYNFIPNQLHPFVNVIHESFDATHEREWRVPADLFFAYGELLFLFCPAADFPHFASIASAGIPVLFDLAWLDRV